MADVKVLCSHTNGLELRLCVPGPEGDGMFPTGPSVIVAGPGPNAIAAVETMIDGEFAAKWFEQNADSPLVTRGVIRLAPKE